MSIRHNAFLTCYDDTGAAGGAAGAAGAGAAGAAGAAGGEPEVKNQNDLNAVLKREKDKFRQRDEQRAKELEEMKNTLKLTEEQKQQFETQIEELRTAHLTSEEKAKRDQDRLNKDWQGKFEQETQKATYWERQFATHKIGHSIQSAALSGDVIPQNVKFLESFLGPRTRLVEIVGEDGKGTGDYTAKVKFPDADKEGKPITLDLTVPEAVKRMKELPDEYGYLFKSHTQGGLGGQSGSPGKKPKVAELTTAEYMKRRKEDPASLGLE